MFKLFLVRLWHKKTFTELYDLKNDPFEHVNVVDDPKYAAVVERLKTRLRKEFQRE